jgi:acetylornithine aminotransferase
VEAELKKAMLFCNYRTNSGGLDQGTTEFFSLEKICKARGCSYSDEVQSGFEEAESFAHQFHNIKPDIICMLKEWGTDSYWRHLNCSSF